MNNLASYNHAEFVHVTCVIRPYNAYLQRMGGLCLSLEGHNLLGGGGGGVRLDHEELFWLVNPLEL